MHAITGPSGAGKTTLLSLISGLANPTEGMVLVDGTDLSERDRYRFRSHDIGVIFQSFNLLSNLTVAENIILSMDASGKSFDKPKKAIVEELLKQVHLPKEYANERILHLSGGEQQRLVIARALLKDAPILILDDSTSAVDTRTDALIREGFRTYIPETTKIIIAQRVASVQDADLILVMDNGHIADMGTHEELLASSEIYREVYESQTNGGEQDEA